VKDVPEIEESPEKQITKTSESKIETFDDLKTADKPQKLETFDDLARGKGSHRSIETFDDIAKSKEGTDHYEIPQSFENKSITGNTSNVIEKSRIDHWREKSDNYDKDVKAGREKRSEIVEEMVTNDFPVTSEKHSNSSKNFHYVDETEFAKELKEREPLTTQKDVDLTKGFHDRGDDHAFVKEDGDTFVTALHEKLHQKGNSELPTRLDEGMTEHFARKEAGALGELKNIDDQGRNNSKVGSDYENEVEIVGKLEATVGQEPLQKAYFEGKTEILKNHVDSVLGDDAFQRLNEALERKDYETASKIIEKK